MLAACGGDEPSPSSSSPEWIGDIRDAVDAVEDERGGPQTYFEVTASPQLTNVFVASDDGTSAIPYLYVDGVLEQPGPALDVESGQTFVAAAIGFDEDTILRAITEELPDSTIDALSVEGGPGGTVRYVASVRSAVGGVLDVVIAADGSVLSVTPL